MFWKFSNYANVSTIDTILDKPDVTLEELLAETDLIQELKHHNNKLIEFLRDESNLQKMLDYVVAVPAPKPPAESTAEPGDSTPSKSTSLFGGGFLGRAQDDEEKDETKRQKYALVCCEVLSSDTWSLSEALIESPTLLPSFWRFLNREPPLSPLQASYFTKVNETLLEKRTGDMIRFFKSIPDVVPKMLKHVDCPMVMDLLLKIISVEKAEGGAGIVDWLQSQRLIPQLLAYLTPEYSQTTQTSTGNFLKAVITISANAVHNDSSCIGPNNLTRELVSDNSINALIGEMLKGGNPLTVGVEIIIEVIRKNNSDYDDSLGAESAPSGRDPVYLGTLLRIFASRIPDFMKLIMNQSKFVTKEDGTKVEVKRELKAAFGGTIEPLGFDRFKTCELMAELLHCSNMALLNQRGSDRYIKERDKERERLQRETEAEDEQTKLDISFAASDEFQDTLDMNRKLLEVQNGDAQSDEEFEEVAMSTELPATAESTDKKEEPVKSDEGAKDESLTTPSALGFEEVSKDFAEDPMELDAPTVAPLAPKKVKSPPPADVEKAKEASKLGTDTASETIAEVISTLESLDMGAPLPPKDSGKESEEDKEAVSPTSLPKSPAPLASGATVDRLNADLPPLPVDESLPPSSHPPPVPDAPPAGPDSSGFEGDASMMKSHGEEYAQYGPLIEDDLDGGPLIGDYLKMMFVEHSVVPTILEFFFRFPWNNFLHNVVYDVVQQVFSGPMDKGFNRNLAIDLFETGKITERIVEGQRASDKLQKERNMRMGYMGHLTLIAEEVVRFTEKYPPELFSQSVLDKVTSQEWVEYVENTLAETRERDNAILGGVRPEISILSLQKPSGGGMSSLGGLQSFSGGDSGLDTIDLTGANGAGIGGFGGGLLSGSGFTSSSDEDDDEHEREEDEEEERQSAMTDSAQFESYISGFRTSSNFQTSLSGSSSSSSSPEPRPDLDIESDDIDLFAPSEIPAPLHVSRTNLSHIPLFPSPSPTTAEHPLSPKLAEAKIVTSGQYGEGTNSPPSGSSTQPPQQQSQQQQDAVQLPGWKRRERGGSISGGTWEGREDFEKEQTKKEQQEGKGKGLEAEIIPEEKEEGGDGEKPAEKVEVKKEIETPLKETEKVEEEPKVAPVKTTESTSSYSK